MGKLHDAIVALMTDELEARTEWDEPPQLYRLHLTGGAPRIVPVRIPLPLWESGRTPDVLENIADMLTDPRFRPRSVDLHGMAFRHEGWEVIIDDPRDPANRAEAERISEMSKEHTLHTRPDRIEVRMMYAVDRAQITYQAHMTRGDAKASSIISYPGNPAMQMTGSVLQALDSMVASLTGIPQQTRVDPDKHPIWEEMP
jgi:hypothetical protein